MESISLVAAAGALAAGVSGSVHCALMCGPLACAAGSVGGRKSAALWHFARVVSYALVGLFLGASTGGALKLGLEEIRPVLPWVMAAGLVLTAAAPGALRLPALTRVAKTIIGVGAKFSPGVRAYAMGAATPFLPCGLVYGMALTALAAGSAPAGGLVMTAFAVGGVPALAASQAQLGLWNRSPRVAAVVRRVVPLLGAAVLVWRAVGAAAAVAPEASCH